jgi:molybdopterin-guanine dinucleotide biosynthesis protein A
MQMVQKETDITGVILVGGKSSRMGLDKAFLEMEGTPLFERLLAVFRDIFARTVLVGGQAERFARYGLTCHTDIHPGSALGGLYTALVHADTPYIFVSACDLPFPSSAVARSLVALRTGYDAVVARGADGFEPLFALYAVRCREVVLLALESGSLRICDLYPRLNVRIVPMAELARLDGGERAFINVNTPAEFRQISRGGHS